MSDKYSALEFYGGGFGYGVFSSIFAMVGFVWIFRTWKKFFQLSRWTSTELLSSLFMSAPGILFGGVPLWIGLSSGVWVVTATGYGLPIVVAIIKYKKIKKLCKNPSFRQQHDNDVIGINNDDDKPSYKSLEPKRNAIIWDWLGLLDLVEYHDVLVREGYATLSDLQSITAEDLKGMGITKPMHVEAILRKISDEMNVNAGPGTNVVYGETGGYSQINLNVDVDIAQPAPGYDDDADVPPAYDSGDVTVF